ncbi:MAG: cupin domain-containing protein [Alphaproteobacteria bacterium]
MTEDGTKVAIDALTVKARIGSSYPEPFAAACEDREKRALGNAFGLSQFGVNHVRLAPGAASSQRHWHSHEDELVYMLEGEAILITDEGEQVMTPGMCTGFKAGAPNGHHLINRSDRDAVYLEIGTRASEGGADYPDIDMIVRRTEVGQWRYLHKDGTPY